MKDKIAIALIGAGRIGAMHARLIVAHPQAQLSAVYDANMDIAKKVAQDNGTTPAKDITDAIANCDAVFIASATHTHCDYIEQAAAMGKPILCEKPIDLDIKRVEQCRQKLPADALVQIGFNRRFDPGHAAMCKRASNGEVGHIEKLIITSRDPAPPAHAYLDECGGLFHDMMIHDFDLARFVLPEEPVRIVTTAAALVLPERDDADTAMALMQTKSGLMCHINCSRRAVYGYDQRAEVFGEKGMLISGNRTATEVSAYHAQVSDARDPLLNFFIERYADSYRLQLDAFIECIKGKTTPSPSFEDGRRALIIANAAKESLQSGQWIDVSF